VFGICWLAVDDALVNLVVVLIEMRWETHHKLVQEGSYAIDVCTLVMTLASEYFRTHVLWGTTKTKTSLAFLYNFGQPKICDFKVAINIY